MQAFNAVKAANSSTALTAVQTPSVSNTSGRDESPLSVVIGNPIIIGFPITAYNATPQATALITCIARSHARAGQTAVRSSEPSRHCFNIAIHSKRSISGLADRVATQGQTKGASAFAMPARILSWSRSKATRILQPACMRHSHGYRHLGSAHSASA